MTPDLLNLILNFLYCLFILLRFDYAFEAFNIILFFTWYEIFRLHHYLRRIFLLNLFKIWLQKSFMRLIPLNFHLLNSILSLAFLRSGVSNLVNFSELDNVWNIEWISHTIIWLLGFFSLSQFTQAQGLELILSG